MRKKQKRRRQKRQKGGILADLFGHAAMDASRAIGRVGKKGFRVFKKGEKFYKKQDTHTRSALKAIAKAGWNKWKKI